MLHSWTVEKELSLSPEMSFSFPEEKERRGSGRFPIAREVRFRILSKRSAGEAEEGTGTTINISSNGVLFSTDQVLIPGRRLEISISWPAELDNKCQLKLVARGRVARLEQGRAAVEIQQYEFRTAGFLRVAESQLSQRVTA
ncbi:MAG: PilZ domain-containing protein [Bryobacteraceae bacterium]|nr:PilZ domain-containing protein [Bryobacteraceae bacterium]